MTTAQFIEKTYNVRASKERRCSSVFTDYQGTVYSYGYHYPLAFNVAGIDFINERGYSTTTSKHISWARQALDYDYVPVELDRADAQVIASTYAIEDQKLDVIRASLHRQRDGIIKEMEAKKRKDTQVYAMLERDLLRVESSIKKVGK